MARIGHIVTTIRKNADGTYDRLYLECVKTKTCSCKDCYAYYALPARQRTGFCKRNCSLSNTIFDLWVIKNI
jgi:hypothetical protein